MKVIDKFGNTKTNLVGSSTWGAITGTLSDQTDLQSALDAKQALPIEVTGSLTAANNSFYIATATATFTDPTSVQGKGFIVYIRAGTSTIGGTAYAAGSYVLRFYSSAAWSNKNLDPSSLPIGITIGTTTITSGTSGRVLYNNAGVVGEVSTFKWTLNMLSSLTGDIYPDFSCSISSVSNVVNAPTTTILLNGAAYTFGNPIVSGDKVTISVSIPAVISLNFAI